MIYRAYGKTGKEISAISAGTMRFKTPANDDDVRDSARVLLQAYDKGVNYFDTAPYYCGDRSEDITARAIRDMKPGTFYLSTKSGRPDGRELREQLEKSLKRLGVDCINFFHVWCVMTPEDWAERKEKGAVAAAFKAQKEGLVEHVVFSTHMTGAETAAVIGENIFEGMTIGYNALNFPYRQEGITAAGAANIGVVIMNPLAGGLIPAHAKRFDFIRRGDDPDVVAAALRFLLSHQAITSALVGFAGKAEVDQAVAAVENFVPYSSEEVEVLKRKIENSFDQLCTGCQYCLPCPAGVPIPKYMDSFNMKMLSGTDEAVLERLKWHWDIQAKDAAACTACGLCESRCTQHLPIIERLKTISRIPARET